MNAQKSCDKTIKTSKKKKYNSSVPVQTSYFLLEHHGIIVLPGSLGNVISNMHKSFLCNIFTFGNT